MSFSCYYFNSSWAGLRDGRFFNEELAGLVLQNDRWNKGRANVNGADVILLDEISMLILKDFEQLEMVVRIVTGNTALFWGQADGGSW